MQGEHARARARVHTNVNTLEDHEAQRPPFS